MAQGCTRTPVSNYALPDARTKADGGAAGGTPLTCSWKQMFQGGEGADPRDGGKWFQRMEDLV
jgi:hypothetical protein